MWNKNKLIKTLRYYSILYILTTKQLKLNTKNIT